MYFHSGANYSILKIYNNLSISSRYLHFLSFIYSLISDSARWLLGKLIEYILAMTHSLTDTHTSNPGPLVRGVDADHYTAGRTSIIISLNY